MANQLLAQIAKREIESSLARSTSWLQQASDLEIESQRPAAFPGTDKRQQAADFRGIAASFVEVAECWMRIERRAAEKE